MVALLLFNRISGNFMSLLLLYAKFLAGYAYLNLSFFDVLKYISKVMDVIYSTGVCTC